MGQLELVYVPVKGWIIDPKLHGLLNSHTDVVCLTTHGGKIIHTDVMTRDVAMVTDGGRGLEVYLELFPKSTCRFTFVIQLVTCTYSLPHFLCDLFPVLGGHQEVPDGVTSFKMNLDSHLTTNILEAFT